MTLKSILVHVDDGTDVAARLEVATELARTHDAHLTGVAIWVETPLPTYVLSEIPRDIAENFRINQAALAAKAREAFTAAMQRAGWADRSNWVDGSGDIVEVLARHARCADLTIAGQPRPRVEGGQDAPADMALPDEYLLQSGRPALLVPYVGVAQPVGRHVVIAWDGSRESARAVADAMPLLERAQKVEILSIVPADTGDLPGVDLAHHLAHHNIKAETRVSVGADIAVGDVLLNEVANRGADLIVMGAYGHSRLREIVFGGATRHILEHMTVPVLLSH